MSSYPKSQSHAQDAQGHPQMGALREALESAGRSAQAAEAALERTRAELLTERMRRAQMVEQCERAILALNSLRDENKRLRTLVAEKGGAAGG
ncbi:MAG TPA: hypothetical protein VK961_04985 [Chthoniobacter sp.]|nr:hypothetical protein [Chthoniobacter sp.]